MPLLAEVLTQLDATPLLLNIELKGPATAAPSVALLREHRFAGIASCFPPSITTNCDRCGAWHPSSLAERFSAACRAMPLHEHDRWAPPPRISPCGR